MIAAICLLGVYAAWVIPYVRSETGDGEARSRPARRRCRSR